MFIGAPIEGEEVSEAFLLGKDDDEDEAEEKSSTRSDEGDEAGKRIGEHDDSLDPAKKKQKKEDGSEASSNDPDGDKKIDKKTANMRRNIREVMDETQLDEATLAAQRQEMERLRRVQEQQRIIREVQRRQISKGTSLLRSNLGLEDDSEVGSGFEKKKTLFIQQMFIKICSFEFLQANENVIKQACFEMFKMKIF